MVRTSPSLSVCVLTRVSMSVAISFLFTIRSTPRHSHAATRYIECVKFQHFNRLVLPALAIHSYPTLDTTMSHGGVLSVRGGLLHLLACQFFNNSAKQGGAVYVAGTDNITATLEVASASLFTQNYAQYVCWWSFCSASSAQLMFPACLLYTSPSPRDRG